MTIFTAFYVPDGIVMTADSRLTERLDHEDGRVEEFVLSDNEQKIFLVRNNEVGMVYTAEGMPDGFTMSEFVGNMNKFIIKPNDSILDLTLKIAPYINEIEGMEPSIVIAGFDNGEPCVCLIKDKKVETLNRNKNNEVVYGAIVGGETDRINQVIDIKSIDYDSLTIDQTLDLAISLTQDSIEYYNSLPKYSNVGGTIARLTIQGNKTMFVK